MKQMLIGELIIIASNDHCQMSLSFLLFGRGYQSSINITRLDLNREEVSGSLSVCLHLHVPRPGKEDNH